MKFYIKGARLSYTKTLFTAERAKGQTDGTPKFSVACIIEPGTLGFAGDANPESPSGQAKGYKYGDFKNELSKAIVEAANGKWGAKAMEVLGQLKAQNRLPLHDGAEKGSTPGYAGNFYLNASNEIRPQVRHKNGAQLQQSDGVIYSGCYADVVVDIWAMDNQWGKRVNASLLGVVFDRDGEKLAGGSTASEDDFAPPAKSEVAAAAASGSGAAGLFS